MTLKPQLQILHNMYVMILRVKTMNREAIAYHLARLAYILWPLICAAVAALVWGLVL